MNETPDATEEQTTNLPPAPVLPFTIKANAKRYRKTIGPVRVILALVVSLVFLVRLGFVGWLVTMVGLAVVVVVTIYLLTRRTITVNDEGVHFKNPFGVTKSISFEETASVEVFESYMEPAFGVFPRVILAKKSGGFLFSANGLFWTYEDVILLISALNEKKVLLNVYPALASSANISKEFPNLLPFYERHPYWTGLLAAIVLLAGIVAGVLLYMS